MSGSCPWLHYTFNWTAARSSEAETSQVEVAKVDDTKVEKASYQPLVDYMNNVAKLTAFDVSNGTNLPNRLLFDMFVYTLKSDILLTGPGPRFTFGVARMLLFSFLAVSQPVARPCALQWKSNRRDSM